MQQIQSKQANDQKTKQNHVSDIAFSDIVKNQSPKTILKIPLDFQYQPIQLLSKQLTKLNHNYPYRILYLGPRQSNSLVLHKKYSKNPNQQYIPNPQVYQQQYIQKYEMNFNKPIKNSNENIFKIQNNITAIYYRAFEGMNPTIRKQDEELIFDSMFEGGNLDCAVKITQKEYDLFLRVDSNTRGHVLWYYFSIKNGKSKRKIQFNICNIMKFNNLYEKNMKPYVFSKKKKQFLNIGWRQDGNSVLFSQKRLRYQFLYQKIYIRALCRLSFQYTFQYPDDQVFFAYCIPYSYSSLLKQISNLNKYDHKNNSILQITQLGKSLMGLSIPLIKITNPKSESRQKKIILCTGRTHPGQSNGSIMLQGLMKYLCSDLAQQLRKSTIFIIIPMINPDGVILGNYRTGAGGRDLNRLYSNKNSELYPQIMMVRDLVMNIKKIKQIYLFLDFHGHSEKKNTFVYGPPYIVSSPEYYKSKILPKMLSKRTQMFRFYSCVFRIPNERKSAARAVMFEQFKIPYTFTIQSSNGFFYDSQLKVTLQYNKSKWDQMGYIFGSTINEYLKIVQEYQNYINLKRAMSLMKKQRKKSGVRRKQDDECLKQQDSVKEPQSIKYLLSLLQQIKVEQKQQKMDSQKDSDSDNQENDAKIEKIKQFEQFLKKNTTNNNQSVDKQKNIKTENNIMKQNTKRYYKLLVQQQLDFFNKLQLKPKSPIQRKRIRSSVKYKDSNNKIIVSSEINKSKQSISVINYTQTTKLVTKQQSVDLTYDTQLLKTQQGNLNKKLIQKRKVSNRGLNIKMNRKSATNTNIAKIGFTEKTFNSLTMENNTNKIFTVPFLNNFEKDTKTKKSVYRLRQKQEKYPFSNSNEKMKKNDANLNQEYSKTFLISEQSQHKEFNFHKLLKANQSHITSEKINSSYKGFKAMFPSAFYRIKQQISTKKKQQVVLQKQRNNLSLHIKKLK